jgi:hypothetical protein
MILRNWLRSARTLFSPANAVISQPQPEAMTAPAYRNAQVRWPGHCRRVARSFRRTHRRAIEVKYRIRAPHRFGRFKLSASADDSFNPPDPAPPWRTAALSRSIQTFNSAIMIGQVENLPSRALSVRLRRSPPSLEISSARCRIAARVFAACP